MELTQLIEHPELMDKETLYDLRNMVARYPCYQTARLLMLKNLYLLHDSSFDEELRRAAVYITDRNKLFNLVEAAHFGIDTGERSAHGHVAARAASVEGQGRDGGKTETAEGKDKSTRTLSLIDSFLEQIPEEEKPKPRKRKPTPADAAVDYVAYLLDSEDSADDADAQEQAPQLKGQSLIDNFINQDGGKITLKEKPEYVPQIDDAADSAQNGDDGFFTETLAKIYIKQGRYSKALEIIRRLNLNYPKKNAYFADQIRFLEKLIINDNNNKINKQQK